MKKICIFLFLFFPCFPKDQKVPENSFLIDTISAVIFSQEGTVIVPLSNVVRPSLTGAKQSLEDILFEWLVYLDAQKYKIAPDEDALDKYLTEIQKQNNLTLEELKTIFKQAGYSYEEGREQFKRLQTVKSMLDYKIHSNMIVPKKAVEEYYAAHPKKQEAEYQLEYGVMPFAEDRAAQKKQLTDFSKGTVSQDPGIVWNEPFWMGQSEIADDKKFIYSMKNGAISLPQETESGFELYRLVAKKDEKILTLEERYDEIAQELIKPKYEKLMEEYKKQLFDSVSILYF